MNTHAPHQNRITQRLTTLRKHITTLALILITYCIAALANAQTLGAALDNTSVTWSTSSTGAWYGQTTKSYFGGSAARSGVIAHSTSTDLTCSVTGPVLLKFYWSVSSESGYDYLSFAIDGVEQTDKISGTVDWVQKTYPITVGTHTLRWRYSKDSAAIDGSDCGWVDKVEWTPLQSYTVSFNANGGSGTMLSQTYVQSIAQALSANTFTLSGYAFTGWNTAANGSGTSYTNQQAITVSADMTLYAKWAPTYTVAFDANGGSSTMAEQTYTAGVAQALQTNSFTRSGYVFGGWNTMANGSGTSYTNQQSITISAYTTLFAQWVPSVAPTGTGTEANPYQITVFGNLVWMGVTAQVSASSGKFYKQMNDIDASAWNTGMGFTPIGSSSSSAFQGNYDGNGKTINGLFINRTSSTSTVYVGLFGYTSNATIRNLGMVGGNVSANATSSSSYSAYAGGLVGYNYSYSGTIRNCYATVNVTASTTGSYSYAYSGGLVGYNSSATISNCYATGNVTASTTGSYSYAYSGGFIGYKSSGTFAHCYSISAVSAVGATVNIGGFAGYNSGTVTNCYWDTQTSGRSTSAGGTGKTTAEMMQQATYTAWDFPGVWRIDSGIHNGYPTLNPTPPTYTVTFDANGGSGSMAAQTYTAGVAQALRTNTFTRTNYVFGGWNTAADGTGTSYTNSQSITAAAAMTLYAQWTPNYTVTFDANGGSGYMAAQTYTAGVAQTLRTNTFTRMGYAFSGWNSLANGSGTSYTNYQSITISANTTLFAQWIGVPTYTVTFDTNGGSGTMAAQIFTTGVAQALSANTFTRSGYVFNGWNTAANGTGTNYTNQQSITMDANMTLYAQWTPFTIPAGTGTSADPYQITVLGNLVWMGETAQVNASSGKFYKQMNDIDASATTTWVGGQGFAPIGNSSSSAFKGNYNGNGKTISGLYINRTSTSTLYVGLFGYTSGATISNLGMVGGSVTASITSGSYAYYAYVGGLVGYNNGTVSNCFATGNVSATSTSSYAYVGGLVGYNYYGLVSYSYYGTISNCYATGNVAASTTGSSYYYTYSGGLVGYISGGTISNCYSIGAVSAPNYVGGFAGYNYGTVTNCYWDTQTSGRSTSSGGTGKITAQMVQQATFTNWSFVSVWAIIEGESYPTLKAVPIIDNNKKPNGTGTPTDPYQITVLNDLVWMGDSSMGSSGKHYKLMNDIDASETSTWNNGEGFMPIGSSPSRAFKGTFEGNNKKITRLFVNRTSSSNVLVALFGCTNDATIRNLRLEGVSISASAYDSVVGSYSWGGAMAGGLVGRNFGYSGTISNCSVVGHVSASSSNWHYAYAGGLVGSNVVGTLNNCISSATVDATSDRYPSFGGGLVGYSASGTITNCHVTSTVAASSVSAGEAFAGGLIGDNASGTLTECSSAGTATATTNGSLSNGSSPNALAVAGGLLGENCMGSVAKCFSTVNVFAISRQNSYAYVGGLVGENNKGTIANCFATGSVSATADNGIPIAGGLVGDNDFDQTAITNCYASGAVSAIATNADAEVGGLTGQSDYTVTSCFWNTQTSGQSYSSGGTGKTTAQMKQQPTYAGWDFADIWRISASINNGYPYLHSLLPPDTGSVRVTLLGTEGAQWRISGVCPWTDSGALVGNIAVGTYTVEFSAVSGYATPASQQVTVTKDGTATLTVDYRRSAVAASEAFLY